MKKSPCKKSGDDPFLERLSRLKQTEPVTAEESAPYGKVVRLLQERKSRAVVLCRKGKVTGIFTASDLVQRSVLERPGPRVPISKYMTRGPVTIRCDATVGDAIALMRERSVRSLPLVDGKMRLKGLLSVGLLIRYLAFHFPAEVVNLPPAPKQLPRHPEGA